MPMVMENLAMAQHWDMLCYAIVCGGCYWLQIHKFELRDYIYLQQTTMITLNVITQHVILHVWKILPFGMLLLEG